jgi:hypothetical protein
MLESNRPSVPRRDPWNKGRLIGQKRPLKPRDVWSIRVRLQVERRARNLALFNLAIDSKLRGPRERFARDSALEGDGFELSVPRVMGGRFRTTSY